MAGRVGRLSPTLRPRLPTSPGYVYCLLLKDHPVTDGTEKVPLLQAGTLLVEANDPLCANTRGTKVFRPLVESEGRPISIPTINVVEVLSLHLDYLLAIARSKRIPFVMNRIRLEEVVNLQLGAEILVINKSEAVDVEGIVRYIGPLSANKGTWFGVEVKPQFAGRGAHDGTFRNISYFSCQEDCGFFLRPSEIRSLKPKYQVSLDIGSRVQAIIRTKMERGTVRWIGFLPDEREEHGIKVGIEFDNAVGKGTGKYRGKQLFLTKKNHGLLVHIMGLVPEVPSSFPSETTSQDIVDGNLGTQTPVSDVTPHQPQVSVQPLLPIFTEVSCISDEFAIRDSIQGIPLKPPGQTRSVSTAQSNSDLIAKHRQRLASAESSRASLIPRSVEKKVNPASRESTFSASHFPIQTSPELQVGSRVEVFEDPPQFGTIRWIGTFTKEQKQIAGVEMDEPNPRCYTSGYFAKKFVFDCRPHTAFFINLDKLSPARSSPSGTPYPTTLDTKQDSLLSEITGLYKGIQGETNSCYMDASLFALFRFSTLLDEVLELKGDSPEHSEASTALAKIVSKLREDSFVPREMMASLRNIMSLLFPSDGFQYLARDPEEFLNCLLGNILKVSPFLQLNTGQEMYIYQVFCEQADNLLIPTTQQLLHSSFMNSDLKMRKPPSLLMLQMPRSGKTYRMFEKILPSPTLDITDLLEGYPKRCSRSSKLATVERLGCHNAHDEYLQPITYSQSCSDEKSASPKYDDHQVKELYEEKSSKLEEDGQEPSSRQSVVLELIGVLCIETSHYVAFTKCEMDLGRVHWLFFDSMADRRGFGSEIHNVPQVSKCPEVGEWFSSFTENSNFMEESGQQRLGKVERLLKDGYLCIYQKPGHMNVMK